VSVDLATPSDHDPRLARKSDTVPVGSCQSFWPLFGCPSEPVTASSTQGADLSCFVRLGGCSARRMANGQAE
jgi:hypothetical protein